MNSFEAIKVADNVYWVGAIDWGIRNFHGYATSRGTTYNAYLITGETPVLIDTVKAPFFEEMMARIKSVMDPSGIKYIISNHSEMDHSGALPRVIQTVQPEKVYASKMGVKALEDHFHLGGGITEVSNGQTLEFPGCTFTFVETRMLHWPDSMVTYYREQGVLFSQDGFGMHFATPDLCSSDNDRNILRYEAAKYYANILLPYSPLVTGLLGKLPSLGLDIRILAPDHGPYWKGADEISWITSLWAEWARQEGSKAVIVYDSMWGSTSKMAQSISDGVASQGAPVAVMPLSSSHRSDIATELLDAGAFIVGSPTINKQMFPTVADMLCYIKGLNPKNMIAQAFGSYGWGGEAPKLIAESLSDMGLELLRDPLRFKYVPSECALSQCRELGVEIGKALKGDK